ncbi:hypothetical protein HJC10_21360 [Corallococcus exiguus]|uniref:hypothetical protein n=1 Tax=Corallococcus exiguus TaxID=83462 RepID=UPI0014713C94|nr:hypothetical protein [Corallococcus exiguus]NNB88835.1 hypothetical protein [Corallococcus exiguus]NNB96453.1 hypothetical protein [Corallococcus exiguus]NNC05390.1 hypothetical protein [Corallococcus exiguus]NRD47393.1 hypothetical protein [Corallococcus exiguus]
MTSAKLAPTGGLSAAGIGDVLQGIRSITECVRDIAKEQTEQTRLRENARVNVEHIHAMRDVLMHHLDRSFDERKENFRQLFERLDGAIQGNNVQLASVVLESVVKLADASPFKALQDVAATRAALGQKGQEWQF